VTPFLLKLAELVMLADIRFVLLTVDIELYGCARVVLLPVVASKSAVDAVCLTALGLFMNSSIAFSADCSMALNNNWVEYW
jgi:hypothetical protein